MTTREQDNVIERMAGAHGRLMIRDGYADGSVFLTLPTGKQYKLSVGGMLAEAGGDWTPESLAFAREEDAPCATMTAVR